VKKDRLGYPIPEKKPAKVKDCIRHIESAGWNFIRIRYGKSKDYWKKSWKARNWYVFRIPVWDGYRELEFSLRDIRRIFRDGWG
jgi:hypothetical protein